MADRWVEVNSFPIMEVDANEPANGEPAPEPDATAQPDEPGTSPDLQHIFDLEDEVDRCEADYLAKAESAKNAKKSLEASQTALNRFIRKLKEELPLFPRDASGGKPAALSEEAWREQSVRLLEGLSESIHEAFEEAGLFTIGQLCDWRKDHELIELPGVGAAKVTKIEDALEAFWASQNLDRPAEEPQEVEA